MGICAVVEVFIVLTLRLGKKHLMHEFTSLQLWCSTGVVISP